MASDCFCFITFVPPQPFLPHSPYSFLPFSFFPVPSRLLSPLIPCAISFPGYHLPEFDENILANALPSCPALLRNPFLRPLVDSLLGDGVLPAIYLFYFRPTFLFPLLASVFFPSRLQALVLFSFGEVFPQCSLLSSIPSL